jgi:cell wall-associated NlpC family hydrolase
MGKETDFSDMIGVPYKDGGRDLSGFDCYGATIEAAKRRGKTLRDVRYKNHAPELADENAPTLNVEKIDAPEEDALIEMIFNGELHIGFCIDEKTFLHATKNQGVRISRIGVIPVKNFYRIK